LGIRLSYSRPAHPQTNGKDERFHRSLKAEVLDGNCFATLGAVQHAFDQWRTVYNQERPHEALQLATPITRYRPSTRSFPETLLPIEYGAEDCVIQIGWNGQLRFNKQRFKVSSALHRLPVAVRPHPQLDGHYDLYFLHHHFQTINCHLKQR
jgi:hypothetical protein